MTQIVQGSLTMLGLNTPEPRVFWNGLELKGILSVRVDSDEDEQHIKIKVNQLADNQLVAEMLVAGINIKRGQ